MRYRIKAAAQFFHSAFLLFMKLLSKKHLNDCRLYKGQSFITNVGRILGLFGWLESSFQFAQLPGFKLESFLESELGFKLLSVL
jgi:hypothetical protein